MNTRMLVAILLPLILGAAIVAAFHALGKTRFVVKGVVAPYFAAIALLFALFSRLLTTEAWQKVTHANTLLMQEANSARSLLRIAEPLGDVIRYAVAGFLKQIEAQEIAETGSLAENAMPPTAELYRIAAEPAIFKGNLAAHAAFYTALESVRTAWFERRQLRQSRIATEKFFILCWFGFLTQIAIALCHIGNPRALAVTVLFFSLSFSGATGILTQMDDPFSTSYLIKAAALADVR